MRITEKSHDLLYDDDDIDDIIATTNNIEDDLQLDTWTQFRDVIKNETDHTIDTNKLQNFLSMSEEVSKSELQDFLVSILGNVTSPNIIDAVIDYLEIYEFISPISNTNYLVNLNSNVNESLLRNFIRHIM